jgi:two-component system, NtrC family, response regulator HydG
MSSQGSVMVVDDDKGMTETLSDILTDRQYSVEIANSGFEAIEKVKIHAYDMILMDMKMPGISGLATYREIKKIRPGAVVMLMTACTVQEIVATALKEGVYGIMYKPIDIGNLQQFIKITKRGALILFVDVELATSQMLIDALRQAGYRIAYAKGQKEARDFIQSTDYDLVFIEVKMDILNGLETYKTLNEIKSNINIIITIKQQEELQDLNQVLDDGTGMFIYKPFKPDQITKLLERIKARRNEDINEVRKK